VANDNLSGQVLHNEHRKT